MKICSACSQELRKEKFSKKQWQAKQQRRCKDCIAVNREITSVAVQNEQIPGDGAKDCIADNREVNLEAQNEASSRAGGEKLFITPEQYHKKFCLHRRRQCAAIRGASDEDLFKQIVRDRRAAELFDKELFKQPPPGDECPICMLTLPFDDTETTYFSCCGKVICNGCVHAHRTADNRNLCPFCRTPASTSDGETIKRVKKRTEGGDVLAINSLGWYYYHGGKGLRQDHNKAMELYLRAGELGYAAAYFNLGNAYRNGDGVERDAKKAKYYYELAAMGGDTMARHNLGCVEGKSGNVNRALKHFMITAAAGHDKSLKQIREGYLAGYVTKVDFERALRAHKESKDEMRSEQREAAAKYYGRN